MSPAATQKPTARRPVYQAIRQIPLIYDQVVECQLPEGCEILGVHAQPEGGLDENGKPKQKYTRNIEPLLMYRFVAERKLVPYRILLLRGQADLPLDPDLRYDFLGSTVDKNPRHSGFATAWLISDA